MKHSGAGRRSVGDLAVGRPEHLDAADLDYDGAHALDDALVHGGRSMIVGKLELVELEGANGGLQRRDFRCFVSALAIT